MTLPRSSLSAVFVALALTTAGCTLTFDATTLGVETTMASPASAPPQGQEFSVKKKAVYLAWGMLWASKPSLRKTLAAQVTGDARVADLRVRVSSRWSDLLITMLTAGLVVPRTVTFEGVIVEQ
ncbi:MAG: hypothetical protein GTN62_14070 [Gemmatimonadales bacterium]|nr:hypothetical protein [Gemmatimonadales bacterium]NIN13130.1 hypothetical protein [Gemmatimonadales bacterium]NIN51214.1 hypothetical protein [Gemmatimonadales bacterium]NIP08678.1 hypothetical protein [Gemmatimonadales bacterium]NIR02366.1 hypothetical protein [Gemmatimonadales bacterium]